MNRFYITTPLYYVNDKPHLGSAYSTVVADVLRRYYDLFGFKTKFLTGTDEHGQNIQNAADKRGKAPQVHCDELSEKFKEAWASLNIKYDIFFRTTDPFHKDCVQKALQHLWDKGEIYSKTYAGWYSVSEEIFYPEKELINGKTPSGREVTFIEEKNYFFQMSKYQAALIEYIEKNPLYIQPQSRKNEVLGFLRKPLEDLCISRPKTRLKWGVELPFDKDYVTYVWFDALLNYATGVGFLQDNRKAEFEEWWQTAGASHLIGKDILTTHAVYWSTMLMALKIKLPKTIFAHGWILNRDNEKMSKSRGSVMDPLEVVKLVGVDQLRYFLVHDVPLGNDAPVSHELIISRINSDLANNLGNLLSRSTNLIIKYFDGKAPGLNSASAPPSDILNKIKVIKSETQELVGQFQLTEAIDLVIKLLNDTNRYLEEKAPWKSAKTDLLSAGHDLHVAIEVIRICAILLSPIMPEKCAKIFHTLGINNTSFESIGQWPAISKGTLVSKPEPMFPRIELSN